MMKIRNGFVSNSSSSSFVVFYRPAKIEEIDDEHVHFLGDSICDGRDYFRPDAQTIEYIKANPYFLEDGDYYRKLLYEYFGVWEDEVKTIKTDELISKFPQSQDITIEVFNIDYHSTESWNEFQETYINREE